MVTDTDAATITTEEAARRAGVSPRTIRRWIQRGILPATVTPDGYLIAVGDLGSAAAGAGQRSRPRGHAATDTDMATPVIVNPTARAQLEAIRDEWLAPLVAQITTQAERIGHLEAERDELRRRVEVAEMELSTIASTDPPQVAAAAPSGTGPPPRANNTKGGIWGRLRRRWWQG
jgi:excisionase family DNA binding protein